MRAANFELLSSEDAVKLVAGELDDLERAVTVIDAYDLTNRCHVLISPVYGKITPLEIANFIKEKTVNGVRLQIQLHKLLWGENIRGV